MEDYEKIPVHDFGVALLRGMGWKDGMVVGKNQQAGLVKPMEYKPRPSLLGLGATPAPTITKEKKYIKPGEKRAKPPPTTTSKHPSSSSQNSSRHYSPKYSIIDPTGENFKI